MECLGLPSSCLQLHAFRIWLGAEGEAQGGLGFGPMLLDSGSISASQGPRDNPEPPSKDRTSVGLWGGFRYQNHPLSIILLRLEGRPKRQASGEAKAGEEAAEPTGLGEEAPRSPGPVGLQEGGEVDNQRQYHCEAPEHHRGEELGHNWALQGERGG